MFSPFSFRKSLLLAAAISGLVGAGLATAQVKKGKSRPLETAQLMRGVVKPHCESLKKGLDAGPSSDEAWQDLATHAALLNEMSYVLMDDSRCPDGVWADAASKTLRQGSADVLKAVDSKDLAAAKAAFGNMTKSCGGCHEKHKPKK